MFDYADILSWSNAGQQNLQSWTDYGGVSRQYQMIHADNMLDLNGTYTEDGDHIGQRGALRLGKATWWMLARLAGWDGTPATALTISGNAGIDGATLSYTDGAPKTVTADDSGNYSFTVASGWIGTVTPSKPNYTFVPLNKIYSNIVESQTGQDYTATAIISMVRANPNPTNAASVEFTVTFNEPATGVDVTDPFADFAVISDVGASITGVVEVVSGSIYLVTVNTGSGNGSIRLDIIDDDSILLGMAQNPLGGAGAGNGNFTGETYLVDKTAPSVSAFTPVEPALGVKVPIPTFSASDNEGVTGYLITTSATPPAADLPTWSGSVPKSYICKGSGTFDLYPWVKDAAGNVSAVFGSPVEVTVNPIIYTSTAPNDGWTLESNEFSNAASTKSNTGLLRVGDDARNKQYRSLLYFNTSSLPDKAVITKATVLIKKAGTAGDVSRLGDLVADMKKGFFGLAPLELGDFKAAGERINTAGRFALTTDPGWYKMSLNPLYFKYINLTGTTQFRLRFAMDDNNNKKTDYLSFYAGDSDDNQPQLMIEYYVP